jgi:murein DD-endopeptidase MepM/ murein hydrolase activator NlpD
MAVVGLFLTMVVVLSSGSSSDLATAGPSVGPASVASGSWIWPITGPVIRPFDPPDSPYGSGHRGIDIAAPIGTTVVAPANGTVTFGGNVGGSLFLTIDHGGGVSSTYSWLSSVLVRKGDTVAQGQAVARSGPGHAGAATPHLHLGVKLDGTYDDPLAYLGPLNVSAYIRLAPSAVA